MSPLRPARQFRCVFSLLLVAFTPPLLSAAAQASAASAAKAPAPAVAAAGQWQRLFDGESLAGWTKPGFYREGDVKVENPFHAGEGAIVMEAGIFLSGLKWVDASVLPRNSYELELEAMKLDGGDFFCGLTFPVGEKACSFIVGGWGGTVVGLSNVDDLNASENETTRAMEFEDMRWYRIRVRVTPGKIEAWIDERQMIDLDITNRVISMYPGEIEYCLPLGLASYQTRAAVKNIRLRRL